MDYWNIFGKGFSKNKSLYFLPLLGSLGLCKDIFSPCSQNGLWYFEFIGWILKIERLILHIFKKRTFIVQKNVQTLWKKLNLLHSVTSNMSILVCALKLDDGCIVRWMLDYCPSRPPKAINLLNNGFPRILCSLLMWKLKLFCLRKSRKEIK